MEEKKKYELRDMSGSAFKNRNKRTDNDAAYTGDCKIDGKEYWINVWVKKDKNDNPWFSYSFREKKPKSDYDSPRQPARVEYSDDIPF